MALEEASALSLQSFASRVLPKCFGKHVLELRHLAGIGRKRAPWRRPSRHRVRWRPRHQSRTNARYMCRQLIEGDVCGGLFGRFVRGFRCSN